MAASISINAVTLTPAGSSEIYLTTAKAAYSCSADAPQDTTSSKDDRDDQGAGTVSNYSWTYSELGYSWSFSGGGSGTSSSGSHTFQSLNQGSANTLTASVEVSCLETFTTTTTTYTWEDNGDWVEKDTGQKDENGNPIKEKVWEEDWVLVSESNTTVKQEIIEASGTASATVYTRPGIFTYYNFTSGTIIESQEGLTALKVDNWCSHCGKYLSWLNQNNSYSAADDCKVSSGDLITTEWINKCRVLIDLDEIDDDQVISTSLFESLGTAISIDDPSEDENTI